MDLKIGRVKQLVSKDSFKYILDSLNIKKYNEDTNIQFFQILPRIDSLEACLILSELGYPDIAKKIFEEYITNFSIKDGIMNYADHQGMDCYLPYNEKRDYKIKKLLKEIK